MKLKDALSALIEGKKIRRDIIGSENYIHFVGDKLVYRDGTEANLSLIHDDWELYIDPISNEKLAEMIIKLNDKLDELFINKGK